jgi:acyl carrier protein
MEKLTGILEELRPDVDFAAETQLITGGILDSLDILTLVDELNAAFDIDVKPKYLTAENFNSAESMWKLIQQLQTEG